jgi:hypothetical protein
MSGLRLVLRCGSLNQTVEQEATEESPSSVVSVTAVHFFHTNSAIGRAPSGSRYCGRPL